MRIVSLLPAATEMVCALGLEPCLVGRSHECDFPGSVSALPVCSRASFPDGSSAAIDHSVRTRVRDGLSLYEVDFDLLRSLQPDLVLTQDQCEVCAVTLSQVEALVDCSVLSLRPHCLEDVWTGFLELARRVSCEELGASLVAEWRARLARCKARSGRRVVALEWLDPLMGCGGWTPELIGYAGGVEVLGRPGRHARWTSLEEVAELSPELVLLIPCGFSLERTRREAAALDLVTRLGLPCIAFDGNALFNRSGPRLVESAEALAVALSGEDGELWARIGPNRLSGTR